jgi:N utilization substance protein A
MVHVDIAALRSIEREKEISFDTVIEAIEQALLIAYKHTPHPMPHARAVVDRKSGDVTVWAQEYDAEGTLVEEFDDTPVDFGRIAAMTAKQVIMQRLRDAEHDHTYGEYAGREGDIVTGVVQQDPQAAARGVVVLNLGTIEAILPQSEQVPGEVYEHGTRLKCYVVSVTRGMRGVQVTVSRTHPNLLRKLFALEVPEIADGSVEIAAVAREAGHRSKIAVRSTVSGVNPKGACIGPMGQRVRTWSPSCTARRSTSSTTPRTRPPLWAMPCPRRRPSRSPWSTRPRRRPGSSCPTSSCRSRSAGKGRTPDWPRG